MMQDTAEQNKNQCFDTIFVLHDIRESIHLIPFHSTSCSWKLKLLQIVGVRLYRKCNLKMTMSLENNITLTKSNMFILAFAHHSQGLDNYVWDEYMESVPMSTYLLAFAVTDFEHKTQGKFSVWTRKDAIRSAQYALDIGPKLLETYEKFFDIPYPLPKVDMIALPDFNAGGK